MKDLVRSFATWNSSNPNLYFKLQRLYNFTFVFISVHFDSHILKILISSVSQSRDKIAESIVLSPRWRFASTGALSRKYISRITVCTLKRERERANFVNSLALLLSYSSCRTRISVTEQMCLCRNCEIFITIATKSI